MDDDDNGFFILILGVLAAILMIVSWWHISDDESVVDRFSGTPSSGIAVEAEPLDDDGAGDGAGDEADEEDEFALTAPEPTATEVPAPPPTATAVPVPSTVSDLLTQTSELSSLSALLAANGLDTVLAGDGPFTVFAPSNDALAASDQPAGASEMLESREANLLGYHVVEGTYTATDLVEAAGATGSTRLTTVQGEPLSVIVNGDQVLINGTTSVAVADQVADNGVVHTVDRLLVPSIEATNLLVSFAPIQFASGSADISAESQVTLDNVAAVLAGTDINLTVEGHTDSQGDPILNQNLSQSRARSVVNYLVANGVADARLRAEGFGPDRPVATNDTEEGRALNRRIEFSLR